MSKFAERCLPFFKKLRKVPNFEWTEEYREAFKELKRYLSSQHALSSPLAGEELLIYLSASKQAISAVLVREEGGEQKPIFYVSKVLRDAEVRYLNIEKLAYALLLAVRKFRVYLKSHQGVVMTDQPLKKILHGPEMSGRMLAWSVEISPYCLQYRPRTTIKAQAFADFIAECSFNEEQAESNEEMPKIMEERRIILKGPEGFKICYALQLEFNAFNNVVEYEALINGMLIATKGIPSKRSHHQKYQKKVKAIKAKLSEQGVKVRYQRIPREENEEADLLSHLSKEELEQLPDEVYIQHINTPAYEKPAMVMEIREGENWMTPYLEYLEKGKLPEDKAEARKIAARAANYQAVRGILYRREKSSPWL
ncbi:uncharacterized protein LOC122723698 [Manihot esculenta]|uniref:uncharacterized protein LOC122723698 n=1 Tax=Manihot esculenta TaxID=3983 RepID=UPI001CC48919|nr:uncharacterized protein LOC122723698 [Manihot esculenta]